MDGGQDEMGTGRRESETGVASSCSSLAQALRIMELAKGVAPVPAKSIENDEMPNRLGHYSQAVCASGELINISGQTGVDPGTNVPPFDLEAQARVAFDNLFKVLRAADLTPANIVKTTVYLTDVAQFPVLNGFYGEYFSSSPPARAAPIVQLPQVLLISVDAIAAR